jgi:hypothetical protein
MYALRPAFPVEKPPRGTIADPVFPIPQTLISRWNLLGCHGISSVNGASAVPKTGPALHHLVTAVSVKKALMACDGIYALLVAFGRVVLPAHTRPKCEAASRSRIARMGW